MQRTSRLEDYCLLVYNVCVCGIVYAAESAGHGEVDEKINIYQPNTWFKLVSSRTRPVYDDDVYIRNIVLGAYSL